MMQGTSINILGVFTDVRDVVKTLSSLRPKVEGKHAKCFQEACQIAEKLGITLQNPRTCQVQRNRANTPADTMKDHYKRNLTIPLVDHLINELENQFGSGDLETAVQWVFTIPSMLLALKETRMTSFVRFCTFHEDSLPSPLSLMPRWLYGNGSWNDKIPRPSRQLHQQLWRRSTKQCILTSQSASKYFHLTSHHIRVWKECADFEATENIFTKNDVTDQIDRTCLAAHSLQHGHWLWRTNSQICEASSKENGTGKYIVWLTRIARKGHSNELKLKNFPGGACPRTT